MSKPLVFNLRYWWSPFFTVDFDPGRPWAVSPPCHAGCGYGHRIGWEGVSFSTWREAIDYANAV